MKLSLETRLPHSKRWYCRIRIHGKSVLLPLGIQIDGVPPETKKSRGDEAYEKSRWRAEERLQEIEKELSGIQSYPKAHLVIERFRNEFSSVGKGAKHEKHLLADSLADAWLGLPARRKRDPESSYCRQVVRHIERLVDYARIQKPGLKFAFEISEEIACGFLKAEEARGVTGKTYNNLLTILKSVFNKLKHRIGSLQNPFADIPKQQEEVMSRRPFNEAQLMAIHRASEANPLVGPIVIVGIYTALREGDCCLLEWDHVDLDRGEIQTRTAKTGERTWIPILPPLRKLLVDRNPARSGYVFPEQAALYRARPDAISSRVVRLIRGAVADSTPDFQVTSERKRGLRRASLADFHGLRTTWVTLALLHGVPESLVISVTGHSTVAMIRKHYFRPGRDAAAALLRSSFASLSSPADEKPATQGRDVIELLETAKGKIIRMNDEAWKERARESVLLIEEVLDELRQGTL